MQEVQVGKNNINGSGGGQAMAAFKNEHKHKVNEDSIYNVGQIASNNGLNRNIMQQDINNKNGDLKAKNQAMQNENRVQRGAVEYHNETLGQGLQGRADRY